MSKPTPIANANEVMDARDLARYGRQDLYRMWLGPYGTTVYVWADSFESAFEELVEWADDEAPGFLVDVTEEDLREAAEDEGVDWPKGESLRHFEERVGERTFYKVVEAAEADLTLIGHTTLKHGQYVPSHEWGGDEVTDFREWLAVVARSARELDRDDRDEVLERLKELRAQMTKKRKARAR